MSFQLPAIPLLGRLFGQAPASLPGPADVPAPGLMANPDHAALLEMVDRRYEYSRRSKQELLETWATVLAFLVGEQWRQWEDKARRLVKRTQIPAWRVLMVDNQIPAIVDVASAKLARSRQIPRALANTGEPEDLDAAQAGSRALEHWWRRDQMDQKELEANVQRILFGCGFFHDYWDPRKEARVPVPDPMTGQVTAQRAPVGDVCVEVLSVFDVFPEPVERWDDVSWCIVARRKPLHWFRRTFGEAGRRVTPDSGEAEDVFSGLIPGTERPGGWSGGSSPGELGSDDDGMATLKVYYELPCEEYPDGRHVMVAGEVVLFAADRLPLPHREIPVSMMAYRYVPKRLWPMGLVEHMLGQQRELNRSQSNLAEILRLFRSPKRWIDSRWQIEPDAITSAPDEVVTGHFNGVNPAQWVESPPTLPAWLNQYPEAQREAIRQLAGQHEVSQGGVPTGVTAASAIGLLQEADNTRLSAPARLGKRGLEDVARHVLITIVERYREPRLTSTLGRDRQQQIFALSGADIGDRDVFVDLSEGVADTDAVRQQQVFDWMGAGLFETLGTPLEPMLLQVLRDVGQVWLAEAIEQARPAMAQGMQQQALAAHEQEALAMEQQAAEQETALAAQAEESAADREFQAMEKALDRDAAGRESEAERRHRAELARTQAEVSLRTAALRVPPKAGAKR